MLYKCLMGAVGLFMALTPVAMADDIIVGTGVSVANEVLKPIKSQFERQTGHRLIIVERGPYAAMAALKAGRLDAIGVGMSLPEVMDNFRKRGIANPESVFSHTPIGTSKLRVVLHPANPVSRLTREQIKGLLTGKIVNWRDVGGKDSPVMVVIGNNAQGVNNHYRKAVMDNEPYATGQVDADTGSDVRSKVSLNETAIGLVTEKLADGTVKVPEQPQVKLEMHLITKGKPSPKVQKLLSYIN